MWQNDDRGMALRQAPEKKPSFGKIKQIAAGKSVSVLLLFSVCLPKRTQSDYRAAIALLFYASQIRFRSTKVFFKL